MRVTTLIENRPSEDDPHLKAEWGLSLHISYNGHSILFDTGSSGSFAANAERLSVDIASVDSAVLSHHHFDHGGGLARFLELNPTAEVHLGEAPHGDPICRILGFVKKYIGLDKALVAGHPDRFLTLSEPTEILPGVFLLPHIAGPHPKPGGNRQLLLRTDDGLAPDEFAHEIVMAIVEDGELVIFTGCSHNGVLNMVDTVARQFDGVPIKAVIGGLHLVAAPPLNRMAGTRQEVENLARAVLDYPIGMTYTGHCTGAKAFGVLQSVMGNRLADLRTGSCFEA